MTISLLHPDSQVLEVANLSNEDYHADTTAISSSGLKRVLRSPAHFKFGPKKTTKDLTFGDAFHAAVIEPDRFAREYFIYDGRRDGGKYQDALDANPGKTDMRSEEMDRIMGMAEAVRSYEGGVIAKSLARSDRELSIFFRDPRTALLCKIRPDFLFRSAGCFDLKSCNDARPDVFLRGAISDFGYDLSAVMYLDGVELLTGKSLPFYLIAVEKEAPYSVWVYEVRKSFSDPFYRNGYLKYRRALATYQQCLESGQWPGYQNSYSAAGFGIHNWSKVSDPEFEAELDHRLAAAA